MTKIESAKKLLEVKGKCWKIDIIDMKCENCCVNTGDSCKYFEIGEKEILRVTKQYLNKIKLGLLNEYK
ncbi:MAG: hypothetical protein ABSG25_11665 [Bryobacteraceae bacterium]